MFFHYKDVLKTVSNEFILVEANIHLLSTEEGGRKTPLVKGCDYRPNHNFGDESNRIFYIGGIEVEGSKLMFPGETRTLLVTFMDAVGLRELLSIGKTWRLQEGAKLVGLATAEYIVLPE